MEQRLLQILQNCKSIREFKQTHLQILIHGLRDDNYILPKLIDLSSTLGFLDYALRVFQTSSNPNVVAFNTVIKCFIGKDYQKALRIYNEMNSSLISPNNFTFTLLLRCFNSLESLRYGMALHNQIIKLGFTSSLFVQNTLLDFYSNCSDKLDYAYRVFEEIPEKDSVSNNSMICAYLARCEIEPAMQLFDSMPARDVITWNSVISGLSKTGNMELAHSLFQQMPDRNHFSWNVMISGFVRISDMQAAQSIFDQMRVKDVVSWTAMITGYSKTGDIIRARNFFDKMPMKTVISWNAMIAGYVHNRMFDQALNLFDQMLIDGQSKPDEATLISVLAACSQVGSLEHGKRINSFTNETTFVLSIPLGNALIDMFAKCGDVENAKRVFNRMAKDMITWTTMVAGLATNGQCEKALSLFDSMCQEGIKPDDVIFIAVLSACVHGGLVEEGKRVFTQMVHEFDVKPRIEHYNIVVDLLGRAGKFEEAVKFIENMPLEPNDVTWATLLSACKTHNNGELLETVTRKILEQEPSDPAYLTLISSLSASIGQWEDALKYRDSIRQRGVEKVPGCSSIQ